MKATAKKSYDQMGAVSERLLELLPIAREIFRSMLELSKRLSAEGKSCDEVLDMLMPA